MKFKKISENTIRCVLTEADMEENDIELEDFFSNNREKIHEFLSTIMEEARKEIGYENEGTILSMQLMPLPSNGLAITITGSEENDFNGVLDDVKNMLQSMQNEYVQEALVRKEPEPKTAEFKEINYPSTNVYMFSSLEMAELFCCNVSDYAGNMKSALYKGNDGKYYLELSKGRGSRDSYQKVCLEILEYAERIEGGELFAGHMHEHFTNIIPKKAIVKLSEYANT